MADPRIGAERFTDPRGILPDWQYAKLVEWYDTDPLGNATGSSVYDYFMAEDTAALPVTYFVTVGEVGAFWVNAALRFTEDEAEDWTERDYYIADATIFHGDTELPNSGGAEGETRTLTDLYDLRDLLMEWYPGEYRELNEALFANGWYGQGATAESLNNRGASNAAFNHAVDELVGSDTSPIRWGGDIKDFQSTRMPVSFANAYSMDFSNLGNTLFTDTTADGEIRLTEDQINSMADNAAQAVFGRAPSDQEKTMVLNLVRGLEASGVHRPGASDARAELRRAAPVEARTQDMSGVLQNFMSIVAGG